MGYITPELRYHTECPLERAGFRSEVVDAPYSAG